MHGMNLKEKLSVSLNACLFPYILHIMVNSQSINCKHCSDHFAYTSWKIFSPKSNPAFVKKTIKPNIWGQVEAEMHPVWGHADTLNLIALLKGSPQAHEEKMVHLSHRDSVLQYTILSIQGLSLVSSFVYPPSLSIHTIDCWVQTFRLWSLAQINIHGRFQHNIHLNITTSLDCY